MAKNLISDIAQMLGVELGEEFKIKGDKDFEQKTFYFTVRGLKAKLDKYPNKELPAMAALDSLLFGDAEIIKLPWKPKKGEGYYTFSTSAGKWMIWGQRWTNHPVDLALLAKGWVYRTRAEAEAALPKVAAEMGVEYEL